MACPACSLRGARFFISAMRGLMKLRDQIGSPSLTIRSSRRCRAYASGQPIEITPHPSLAQPSTDGGGGIAGRVEPKRQILLGQLPIELLPADAGLNPGCPGLRVDLHVLAQREEHYNEAPLPRQAPP